MLFMACPQLASLNMLNATVHIFEVVVEYGVWPQVCLTRLYFDICLLRKVSGGTR
jgi:hypothetical protein